MITISKYSKPSSQVTTSTIDIDALRRQIEAQAAQRAPAVNTGIMLVPSITLDGYMLLAGNMTANVDADGNLIISED